MVDSGIMSFYNEEFGTIRTVQVDDETWFVAKDVCKSLDLSNTTVALDRLDADERAKFNLGRQGEANIVNEPGLYGLILASRKPEAKSFKRWIKHEVLPSIRKHGAYITEPVIQQVLKNPETVYQLAEALIKEHNKVEELTPYANLARDVMACDNCYTMKEIANLIETGRNTLYNLLRQAGVLSKQTGYNLPLQRYLNSGYFKVKADKPGTKFVITQKGLMFIHKLIKKSNLDNEFDTNKLIELAQKINVA